MISFFSDALNVFYIIPFLYHLMLHKRLKATSNLLALHTISTTTNQKKKKKAEVKKGRLEKQKQCCNVLKEPNILIVEWFQQVKNVEEAVCQI